MTVEAAVFARLVCWAPRSRLELLQWRHISVIWSQINDSSTASSTECSNYEENQHQIFAQVSLALCAGNHRWPLDVYMLWASINLQQLDIHTRRSMRNIKRLTNLAGNLLYKSKPIDLVENAKFLPLSFCISTEWNMSVTVLLKISLNNICVESLWPLLSTWALIPAGISKYIPHFNTYNHVSMLGSKLIHVSEGVPYMTVSKE